MSPQYLLPKEIRVRLTGVLLPNEEGGYTVYVPSLPGCMGQGETLDEALENIRKGIELYLEVEDELLLKGNAILQELTI
jgi:predicted RNase H-like HicB family nuclease